MSETIVIDGLSWVCLWLFAIFANMPSTPDTSKIETQLKRIADALEKKTE